MFYVNITLDYLRYEKGKKDDNFKIPDFLKIMIWIIVFLESLILLIIFINVVVNIEFLFDRHRKKVLRQANLGPNTKI